MNAHPPPSRKRSLIAKVGVCICVYECALAYDRPDRLPCITDLCHRWWPLAAVCVGWTSVHLLRPWATRAVR